MQSNCCLILVGVLEQRGVHHRRQVADSLPPGMCRLVYPREIASRTHRMLTNKASVSDENYV
jgi:hypothetical protein